MTQAPSRRIVGPASMAGMAQLHQAVPVVERQHALIEALRVRAPRNTPGRDLATHLGVTVRTVERDVARLTAAGVPITVAHGPGGGYSIDARRQLEPLTLTPGEAAAIIASLVAVGPCISASAQSVLAKLLDVLIND